MRDEERVGYCKFWHNRPYYKHEIDTWGHIHYVMDQSKYRLHSLLGKSKYLLENPNYLGFRNGPIPGVHNYKNGWWHKYKGNHNISSLSEYVFNIKNLEDSDYLIDKYGKSPKIRSKRFSLSKFMAIDWDYPYSYHGKGRTWKRTRKKKQWM